MERDTAAWVAEFARELGTEPPDGKEVEALLALAGVSAHASERTAAPISCWLAARAGLAPEDALEIAQRLAGNASG